MGLCEVLDELAIAGYAKRKAMTANAPTVDAIAIFFVFIFVRLFLGLVSYLAGRKGASGLSV